MMVIVAVIAGVFCYLFCFAILYRPVNLVYTRQSIKGNLQVCHNRLPRLYFQLYSLKNSNHLFMNPAIGNKNMW